MTRHHPWHSSEFEVINTATYGNCFIFNYAKNSMDSLNGRRKSSLTGPDFGLRLVMNMQQDHYLRNGHSQRVFKTLQFFFVELYISQLEMRDFFVSHLSKECTVLKLS